MRQINPVSNQNQCLHKAHNYKLLTILTTHLRRGLPNGLLHSNNPYAFLSLAVELLSLSTIFCFTWSFQLRFAKKSNYAAPRYALSSTLPSSHPSSVEIFSSAGSVYVPPLMSETNFHIGIEPLAKL
jgi:hypothetical protein